MYWPSSFIKGIRRKNSHFIAGRRKVFFAFALAAIALLNACASRPTDPFRLPNISYPDTGQNAYLWSSGFRLGLALVFAELPDYSIVTKIDKVDVPSEFLPKGDHPPHFSYLLEITAGEHTIEILYKEVRLSFFDVFSPLQTVLEEKSRQTLTFIAEGNHIYAPFVVDECDRTWYWIEDWGTYTDSSEVVRSVSLMQSDGTKTVVSGEAPTNKACEQ